MDDFRPDPRARARDAGLARLRRATRFSIFGATALAGAFAGVAAHSSPGHKSRTVAAPATKRRVVKAVARRQPVRHVAPVQTQSAAPAPSPTPAPTPTPTPAPAPAPVTTSVAPVATTGTS